MHNIRCFPEIRDVIVNSPIVKSFPRRREIETRIHGEELISQLVEWKPNRRFLPPCLSIPLFPARGHRTCELGSAHEFYQERPHRVREDVPAALERDSPSIHAAVTLQPRNFSTSPLAGTQKVNTCSHSPEWLRPPAAVSCLRELCEADATEFSVKRRDSGPIEDSKQEFCIRFYHFGIRISCLAVMQRAFGLAQEESE
jgi:hypothetical protein